MEKREEAKDRPSLEADGDDDEVGVETATSSPSPFFAAHPCTMLQYIVRACAGCLLGLCGGGPDGDGPQPGGAADAVDPGATTQREAEGGNKVMNERNLAGAQVLATRRPPRRPSGPREGRGGSGGSHY